MINLDAAGLRLYDFAYIWEGRRMPEATIDSAKLEELKALDSRRFTAALIADYAVLALALAAGHWTLSAPMWTWLAWPLLWLIIANRQHAILVLMHDATHGLAYKTHWLNELVGEVFCGGPAFVSMATYRHNHLAHHKWMNEDKDPDWVRKLADPEERSTWDFPLKNASLGYWLRVWQRSIAYQFGFLKESSEKKPAAPKKDGLAKRVSQIRLASYVLIAAALTYFGLWLDFLLFWVVPAVFVLTALMRIRAITEHFALKHEGFFSEVRNVNYRWPIEQALFSPHNVALHLDHHLYASVPFYRLPALHRSLRENENYAAKAHINDGFVFGRHSVWKDMRETGPAQPLRV